MIATKAYKLYKLNLLTNKEVLICDKDDWKNIINKFILFFN